MKKKEEILKKSDLEKKVLLDEELMNKEINKANKVFEDANDMFISGIDDEKRKK